MARIYQTRNLIDPNMIQMVGNRADQNVAFAARQNERNAQAIRDIINPLGNAADEVNKYLMEKDALEKEKEKRMNAFNQMNIEDPNVRASMLYWAQNPKADTSLPQMYLSQYNQNQSMKFHDKLRTSEEQGRAQRGLEYTLAKLETVENALKTDPNNPQLLEQKNLLNSDRKFYRDILGMPAIETTNPQETPNPQDTPNPQVGEPTVVPPVEESPYTGMTNEDLVKNINTLTDKNAEWTNEKEDEARKILSNIKDPTTRKEMENKINTRGPTKEKRIAAIQTRNNEMNSWMNNFDLSTIDASNYKTVVPEKWRKYISVYSDMNGNYHFEKIGDWNK